MTTSPQKPQEPIANNDQRPQALGEIGLTNFLPYLLNRVTSSWNLSLQERLRKSGLNTVKMRVLAVLTVSNDLPIKELIRLTVIEQSTLSRALDALEMQRLIERVTSNDDKRIRTIHITEDGRRRFEQFWPGMFHAYQSMLSGIDENEKAALLSALAKIANNLSEFEADQT